MATKPEIPDEAEIVAKRAALAEARRAIAEGRAVSHEKVRRWLLSWGTDDEPPRPACE